MSLVFRDLFVNQILTKAVCDMTPGEAADLLADPQVQKTDIPFWIENTIFKECTMLLNRMPRYEEKIKEKYGPVTCLAKKLSIYHHIWDNWDSLEPCPFNEMRPLVDYTDGKIDFDIKQRIFKAEREGKIVKKHRFFDFDERNEKKEGNNQDGYLGRN